MERLRKGAHWAIGKYVEVVLVVHDKREVVLFPVDQYRRTMQPRHPTGWVTRTGERVCFSPSLSYYTELCSYAAFRWAPRAPNDGGSAKIPHARSADSDPLIIGEYVNAHQG